MWLLAKKLLYYVVYVVVLYCLCCCQLSLPSSVPPLGGPMFLPLKGRLGGVFPYCFFALYDSIVLVCIITAVSPRVSDLLSEVMVRVTLHEVSPSAMAMADATANARYLIAFTRRCF